MAIDCPICSRKVLPRDINPHLDSGCHLYLFLEASESTPPLVQQNVAVKPPSTQKPSLSNFFSTPAAKKSAAHPSPIEVTPTLTFQPKPEGNVSTPSQPLPRKRSFEDIEPPATRQEKEEILGKTEEQPAKKSKTNAFHKAAPLAERMRPTSLDDIVGQELVGAHGVLRGLIEQDRIPSMILWGGPGTGKTTLARCIASMVGCRFVEINSTSSGVAECKRIFAEAKGELGLTGRRTIIFCGLCPQKLFCNPVYEQ
jgi:putative ATPase